MGNTNVSQLPPIKRFQFHDDRKKLLINGFCRSISSEIYSYKQFSVNMITHIVIQHYDYTINSLTYQIINRLKRSKHYDNKKNPNYYLLISLEISKMLIKSHSLIRNQFSIATQKHSDPEQIDKYNQKLNRYLKTLNHTPINLMDFVDKSRNTIGKSLPLCPSKTIDNYKFLICNDPTRIYNGKYYRCLSFIDLTTNDKGEVSYLKYTNKKYNKLQFDKKRLNIWIHKQDMIYIKDKNICIPNKKLKYIRCLTRDKYNHKHCYWRLHCVKLNNNGKLKHLKWIREHKLNE
eukprot:176211_1